MAVKLFFEFLFFPEYECAFNSHSKPYINLLIRVNQKDR